MMTSVVESDINNNDVVVNGYGAGPAWDATTGIGSPKSDGIVSRLIRFMSPGDAVAATATSKPKPHAMPPMPGFMIRISRSGTQPTARECAGRFSFVAVRGVVRAGSGGAELRGPAPATSGAAGLVHPGSGLCRL